MRIISKRIGFKGQGANKIKKKQRLTGRIHNAGEYPLGPIYPFAEHVAPTMPGNEEIS